MIAELRNRNRATANPCFPRIKFCQDNGHRGTGRSPVRIALNRANHSFPLDTNSMQILLGPAKLPNIGPLFATSALHCDPPAPQFGAEEPSNIALWSREESRQVNCFAVAKPGNAGGRARAWSGLGASQIRDFYSLFGWLPKLDRIAIWIFKPRKGPHGGIFLGLFDYHAFTLKMAEDFSHVLHCVIDLTRSWLIFNVLITGHNRPRYRSLDLRVRKISIFERCID